ADGDTEVSVPMFSSAGYGLFGADWSWSNSGGYSTKSAAGNGADVAELPYLVKDGMSPTSGNVAVLEGHGAARVLYTGSSARFFLPESLSQDTGNKEFTLTDSTGDVIKFNNFDMSLPSNERGTLKSITDPAGNVTTVTAYTSDGKPQEL